LTQTDPGTGNDTVHQPVFSINKLPNCKIERLRYIYGTTSRNVCTIDDQGTCPFSSAQNGDVNQPWGPYRNNQYGTGPARQTRRGRPRTLLLREPEREPDQRTCVSNGNGRRAALQIPGTGLTKNKCSVRSSGMGVGKFLPDGHFRQPADLGHGLTFGTPQYVQVDETRNAVTTSMARWPRDGR